MRAEVASTRRWVTKEKKKKRAAVFPSPRCRSHASSEPSQHAIAVVDWHLSSVPRPNPQFDRNTGNWGAFNLAKKKTSICNTPLLGATKLTSPSSHAVTHESHGVFRRRTCHSHEPGPFPGRWTAHPKQTPNRPSRQGLLCLYTGLPVPHPHQIQLTTPFGILSPQE